MHGSIRFTSAEGLALFLKAFLPCTATFDVIEDRGGWTLTFTGGH